MLVVTNGRAGDNSLEPAVRRLADHLPARLFKTATLSILQVLSASSAAEPDDSWLSLRSLVTTTALTITILSCHQSNHADSVTQSAVHSNFMLDVY
jgi:hypothetical protein